MLDVNLTPFNLNKARRGYTIYCGGIPVEEWHYFPRAGVIVAQIGLEVETFNEDGIHVNGPLELQSGPRILWALYYLGNDGVISSSLYETKAEAEAEKNCQLSPDVAIPVQVLID